ncbi:right-handed parallel beta-helix repeat-containing protein [Nocardioides sp. W7]|uniref:right-handed parallel beta-helix repeat-containing protein n=1 Tax=Nocardioides sp. W7 TaxID=2931390 RepID=UPI001FD21D23|nr:right-handed parallel beta-helix repeat-containing protein [Nocardioides sp. W7]
MTRADWSWLTRPRAALAAACAGGLVVAVAVGVWPDAGDASDPGPAVPVAEVDVPSVAPAPTPTDLTTDPDPAPMSPTPSETADHEGGDAGDEPAPAPLLADAAPAGEGPLPDSRPVSCPTATVSVSDSVGLADALAAARPGDVIELADGDYAGNFVATASGEQGAPIFLCGSSSAVIDGGDIEGDYTLHLDGATHWRLVGFTVTGGLKGVMADGTVGSVIQGLTVRGTGDEAVHLRSNSTDNVVADNTISDTGNRREKYGEGVYLGTAVSNWCTYTACQVDRSDRNVVTRNTFSDITSEAVDVKEGTTGGVVSDNTIDGSGMTEADSWIDVKGNNYLVEGNTGTSSVEDGFQTHQILDGWGDLNVFARNHADVGGPGQAISSWPPGSNVVRCDNTFERAADGLSNIPCT